MRIHKKGLPTIAISTALAATCTALLFGLVGFSILSAIIEAAIVFFWILSIAFFRVPKRETPLSDNAVVCPADGTIVAIEQIDEKSFFGAPRIQISIFMSIWNVHVNYAPIGGKVVRKVYDKGRFLVAHNPKSSDENERNTLVFESAQGRNIMVRQIAGFVARRIVCSAKEGDDMKAGDEFGLIKFGSRVDVFLPTDAEIKVRIGDKVRAKKDIIAELN